MTQSDGIAQGRVAFAERLKIDRDSKWSARFVLAAITAADCTGLVVENIHVRPEQRLHLACFRHQRRLVFQKWKDARLDRRHARMKAEHDARFAFAFLIGDGFLVVSLAEEREDGAIDPRAGLDDVRREALLGFLIEIIERLAAGCLVLGEIVVGAVGDTFELLPAEREFVFDVVGALRIESRDQRRAR